MKTSLLLLLLSTNIYALDVDCLNGSCPSNSLIEHNQQTKGTTKIETSEEFDKSIRINTDNTLPENYFILKNKNLDELNYISSPKDEKAYNKSFLTGTIINDILLGTVGKVADDGQNTSSKACVNLVSSNPNYVHFISKQSCDQEVYDTLYNDFKGCPSGYQESDSNQFNVNYIDSKLKCSAAITTNICAVKKYNINCNAKVTGSSCCEEDYRYEKPTFSLNELNGVANLPIPTVFNCSPQNCNGNYNGFVYSFSEIGSASNISGYDSFCRNAISNKTNSLKLKTYYKLNGNLYKTITLSQNEAISGVLNGQVVALDQLNNEVESIPVVINGSELAGKNLAGCFGTLKDKGDFKKCFSKTKLSFSLKVKAYSKNNLSSNDDEPLIVNFPTITKNTVCLYRLIKNTNNSAIAPNSTDHGICTKIDDFIAANKSLNVIGDSLSNEVVGNVGEIGIFPATCTSAALSTLSYNLSDKNQYSIPKGIVVGNRVGNGPYPISDDKCIQSPIRTFGFPLYYTLKTCSTCGNAEPSYNGWETQCYPYKNDSYHIDPSSVSIKVAAKIGRTICDFN